MDVAIGKRKCLASSMSAMILSSTFLLPAYAMHIPNSHTESLENGISIITQVFEEDSSLDPQELIKDSFEDGGYLYTFSNITKDVGESVEEKSITHEVVIPLSAKNASNALEEALGKIEATILYDEEGFQGELIPVLSSIDVSVNNQRTESYTKTITKTFTSSRNDNSVVPDTVTEDGYTWTRTGSISWEGGGFVDNTSIPSDYVATATYTRTASYTANDGYTATVTYEGVVTNTEVHAIEYTLMYKGVLIDEEPEVVEPDEELLSAEASTESPGFIKSVSILLFGEDVEPVLNEDGEVINNPNSSLITSPLVKTLLTILFLVICSLCALKAVWDIFNIYKHDRVFIFARNEISGTDKKMQTVFLTSKKAVIKINHLKEPESKHFKIVLKQKKAQSLLGQKITIHLGKQVIEHVVRENYNTDYEIPVEWNE